MFCKKINISTVAKDKFYIVTIFIWGTNHFKLILNIKYEYNLTTESHRIVTNHPFHKFLLKCNCISILLFLFVLKRSMAMIKMRFMLFFRRQSSVDVLRHKNRWLRNQPFSPSTCCDTPMTFPFSPPPWIFHSSRLAWTRI